jgi:hypothetical protein
MVRYDIYVCVYIYIYIYIYMSLGVKILMPTTYSAGSLVLREITKLTKLGAEGSPGLWCTCVLSCLPTILYVIHKILYMRTALFWVMTQRVRSSGLWRSECVLWVVTQRVRSSGLWRSECGLLGYVTASAVFWVMTQRVRSSGLWRNECGLLGCDASSAVFWVVTQRVRSSGLWHSECGLLGYDAARPQKSAVLVYDEAEAWKDTRFCSVNYSSVSIKGRRTSETLIDIKRLAFQEVNKYQQRNIWNSLHSIKSVIISSW